MYLCFFCDQWYFRKGVFGFPETVFLSINLVNFVFLPKIFTFMLYNMYDRQSLIFLYQDWFETWQKKLVNLFTSRYPSSNSQFGEINSYLCNCLTYLDDILIFCSLFLVNVLLQFDWLVINVSSYFHVLSCSK